MSHLTRKEMKRDEVREWMDSVYFWVGENVKTIFTVMGVVIVLGMVGGVVLLLVGQRAERANEALTRALAVYGAPIEALGADPDDPDEPSFSNEADRVARAKELFESVHEAYGSTAAGQVAGVYIGEIAIEAGDTARARELWTAFVEHQKSHALAATVFMNLISLDRQEGRDEELLTKLREALADETLSMPRDLLLYELGLSLERAGETQEAMDTYQELVDDFPRSPFSADAQQRLGPATPSSPFSLGT